jgi:nucleoside-diphosphate-sugar epimerase
MELTRVLVTGAGGFIGSHVVQVLAKQGCEVFALVRKLSEDARQPRETDRGPGSVAGRASTQTNGILSTEIPLGKQPEDGRGRVCAVELDLNDDAGFRSALKDIRPTVAIHLAWYTEPAKYWDAPENLDCVAMSLKVVRALAESGCQRLLASGTCAEYDWDYEELSEETTPLKPRGLYGVCKNALRETLEFFSRQNSIQFAWLRFFYLYGPGEAKERLVPSIILSLLRGQRAQCTTGEQVRDFLYVEDAAAAVAAVARSTETGPVNIASGQPVRIRTLVETIGRILDRSDGVEFRAVPDSRCEAATVVADPSRLFSRIGWQPAFTMDHGLLRTVNWWKANL